MIADLIDEGTRRRKYDIRANDRGGRRDVRLPLAWMVVVPPDVSEPAVRLIEPLVARRVRSPD